MRKLRVQVIKEGLRLAQNFEHKGTVEGTTSQDKEVDYPIKDKVDIKTLAGDNLHRASVNPNKCHLGRQGSRLGGPTESREC
ncbi:hypothetical protein PR003_g7080 [Phytophthora rubi]|uniref:Uncharacterized protein n=1 Tax=Phytophthora rubi TaxID=129364 RepID=A0A6A4FUW8_9STRA|nr:hypothetical protein PR003_g7080 [Phytophthora rubi]